MCSFFSLLDVWFFSHAVGERQVVEMVLDRLAASEYDTLTLRGCQADALALMGLPLDRCLNINIPLLFPF